MSSTMTLIPVASDTDKWVRHFKEMAEHKMRHAKFYTLGYNQVGEGKFYTLDNNQVGEGSSDSSVQLVTPVAGTVERARGELKRKKMLLKSSFPLIRKRRKPINTTQNKPKVKKQKKTL